MSRPNRLRAVRRSLIARTLAVFLIVLGVTPFTAPFAVFDFADLTGAPASTQDTLTAKDFKESSAVPIATLGDDTTLHFVDLRPEPINGRELRLSRALVLRI
jgi:hypothetical protein